MKEELKEIQSSYISEIHKKKMELYQNKKFYLMKFSQSELRRMTLIALNEFRDQLLKKEYNENIVSIMIEKPELLEFSLKVEWIVNQDFLKNEKNYILPLLKSEEKAIKDISSTNIKNIELIEIISSLSRYYAKSIYYKDKDFEKEIYFTYIKYLTKMYVIFSNIAIENKLEEVMKHFGEV